MSSQSLTTIGQALRPEPAAGQVWRYTKIAERGYGIDPSVIGMERVIIDVVEPHGYARLDSTMTVPMSIFHDGGMEFVRDPVITLPLPPIVDTKHAAYKLRPGIAVLPVPQVPCGRLTLAGYPCELIGPHAQCRVVNRISTAERLRAAVRATAWQHHLGVEAKIAAATMGRERMAAYRRALKAADIISASVKGGRH